MTALLAKMRAAFAELRRELRRLNHARFEGDQLSQLRVRRERVRAVKAALASHHSRPNRCC